jgi:hypothetical protein
LELHFDLLLEQFILSLLDWVVFVVLGKEALVGRVTDPRKFTLKIGGDPKVIVHLAKHVLIETFAQLRIWYKETSSCLLIELLLEPDVELVVHQFVSLKLPIGAVLESLDAA